jgi:hypothetical protein
LTTFSLGQILFLLLILAAAGLGFQIFAAGVRSCILVLLDGPCGIDVAHFCVFAISFTCFSTTFDEDFLLFLFFRTVGGFVVGGNIGFGLIWGELSWGSCFGVPRPILVYCPIFEACTGMR